MLFNALEFVFTDFVGLVNVLYFELGLLLLVLLALELFELLLKLPVLNPLPLVLETVELELRLDEELVETELFANADCPLINTKIIIVLINKFSCLNFFKLIPSFMKISNKKRLLKVLIIAYYFCLFTTPYFPITQ
jgi:hypothetical protein